MVIRKSHLVAWMIILFPICHLLATVGSETILSVLSYYDEVIGCISMIYITSLIITKRLSSSDFLIYCVLLTLTAIGLLSNLISGVADNFFAILIDIVFLWKPLSCYLMMKNYAGLKRDSMLKYLEKFAKISIIVVFVTMILGYTVLTGVTGETVLFGNIHNFVFFWNNGYQTGWLLIGSLLILSAVGISKKQFIIYAILAILPMLLTSASMLLCWVFVAVLFYVFFRENTVFKLRYLALLAVLFIAVTFVDFTQYFLDYNSPRMRFILGSIEVANRFFPLGSGFATFGSQMASTYYSKLYVEFGWTNLYGLGKTDPLFLNDNFFAGILGQFGWLGIIIYLVIIYLIYKNINSLRLQTRERALSVATIIIIVASMIGSASVKSIMGVFVMMLLGLLVSKPHKEAVVFKAKL